jgi:NitT/TauT family transport system ATP-binding protein
VAGVAVPGRAQTHLTPHADKGEGMRGSLTNRSAGEEAAVSAVGPKLVAEGVGVTYESRGRQTLAVSGVNLTMADGEFVAIVGPSGSGKSTFLMAVDGLLPLSAGRIAVNGRTVTKPGADRAVVFQDASLLPWRSVLDNVTYGLELAHRPKKQRDKIGQDLIDLAGLTGFEAYYPRQLSGGMQQRVNIARALAADPEVLLLDEPFSGLDAQTRETMQGELLKIWDERKKTAIFVTHQIDEAVYLADRVIAFSARPARIVAEWRVPFERPRPLELKQSAEVRDLEREIWHVVRAEGSAKA